MEVAMMARKMVGLLMALLVVSLCVACSPSEPKQAEAALKDFFAHLHDGDFAEAAALYGGEYDVLRDWNPDVEPSDHAALWERGCLVNGLQCLNIKTVGAYEAASPGVFEFYVQFEDPSGGVFHLNPQTGTESTFKFIVQETAAGYRVMEMPLYVP
jgi:hypothetical protein